MNKHLLAAMLSIPAAFSAGQAMADFRLNGTQINGIPTPGPLLQGTQINGIPTPGPVLQGTQAQGFARNLETGSAFFQANYLLMPATQQAPAWSALPVSRMVVHVAAAL